MTTAVMDDLYPLGPKAVPADLTKPTLSYKQRAWLALLGLVVFIALYLALTGWFVWVAYRMFDDIERGNPIIGLCAGFLAIFMLKALFFIKRGAADAVEVTEEKQPRLFAFLCRLADEAGAPRPRRVFLSGRVNAAVFYDLSVFNLLLPTHKNLEIGLPLINVLTLSEFKAVLAHEFGHFAQRSMAIGAWVYIAQQIAAHIVAKRDALDQLLNFISRLDLRVAWIGWLLQLIVWSIRSLIDALLRLVVLAQRALSRQMEFQADLVSVSLTGSDELVSALHKLSAADDAWAQTLNFAGSEISKGRVPHDLLDVQTRVVQKMAYILADESYGHSALVPSANPEAHRVFKSGIAQPPKMWSTHPTNADREENAKQVYLPAPHDGRSAWLLLVDVDAVKTAVSAQLIGKTEAKPASNEETTQALDLFFARLQYEPRYRGVYLGRSQTRHATKPEQLYDSAFNPADMREGLGGLYPSSLSQDVAKLREIAGERAALEAVRDKVYEATGGRIVYRGREVSPRELPATIKLAAKEEDEARRRIIAHDLQCRSLHLIAAAQLGGGWKEYLIGLMGVLHFAEHTLADLRDAEGYFGNVFALVTAKGGTIGGKRLERLLIAGDQLGRPLMRVQNQKDQLVLDELLCTRLGVKSWSEMIPHYVLPATSEENISNWLHNSAVATQAVTGALSALVGATLEQLLVTEDMLAQHVKDGTVPAAAPSPSTSPGEYKTFLLGQERERQTRLDLWSRFQTADGPVFAVARVAVAIAIVGTVLSYGSDPTILQRRPQAQSRPAQPDLPPQQLQTFPQQIQPPTQQACGSITEVCLH